MFRRYPIGAFAAAIAFAAATFMTEAAMAAEARKQPEPTGMPQGIYVRITPFGEAFNQQWHAWGHTPEEVLKMIADLKPDVLNRFITGKPNPDMPVPSTPPTTYVKYLNSALQAGAPGCLITPKVHLNDIWNEGYRMDSAQSLRNLAVTPRLRALDLDCYFSGGDANSHKQTLQKFKDMGWTDLGFNFGAPKPTYGYGSYGMALVSRQNWKIAPARIAALRKQGIKTCLAHIDYPRAITEFGKLPPDRQADIIKDIASKQKKLGFRFIYPVLYNGYDATKIVTSKTGPYKGATIFEVIKQRIAEDRK